MKPKKLLLAFPFLLILCWPLCAEEQSKAEPIVYDIVKGEIPPDGTVEKFAYDFVNKVKNAKTYDELLVNMTSRGKKFFSARDYSSLEKMKNYYQYERIYKISSRPLKINPKKHYVSLSVATVKGGHVGFSFGLILTENGYIISDRTDRKASKE